MKKVERVYMSELAKQPYADRLFYVIANGLLGITVDNKHVYWNPLKWSMMTFLKLIYFTFIFIVIIPFVVVPYMLYYANKIKSRYLHDDFKGAYLSDVWILRDFTK